jgi:hypothetical protein
MVDFSLVMLQAKSAKRPPQARELACASTCFLHLLMRPTHATTQQIMPRKMVVHMQMAEMAQLLSPKL